jgi:hypothetical protein
MTVSEFLATLPDDRRLEVKRVRDVVKRNLPKGYSECVNGKMIVYYVDVAGKQVWYAAVAAQKSYLTLHLMPVYGDRSLAKRLADGFKSAGKKLDMEKRAFVSRRRKISRSMWSARWLPLFRAPAGPRSFAAARYTTRR